jgi:starvation-inducible DNA-binding protein
MSTTIDDVRVRGALASVHLQPLLADLIALRLDVKQAHWNMQGPHFRDVHLELDELAGELDGWTDEVAERIVAMGHPADGRAATVAGAPVAGRFPAGFVRDLDAGAVIADGVEGVVARARGRLDALEPDLVSQDLVIGVVAGLEKRLWMLRSRAA